MPDSPFNSDRNYLAAPDNTDRRTSETPTGACFSHSGNTKYEHTGVFYSFVPTARTWIASEATTNESFQKFFRDTQAGTGLAWFTPGSKCTIRSHDASATLVGNGTVAGWYLPDVSSMDVVKRATDGWDGMWRVNLGRIVTDA